MTLNKYKNRYNLYSIINYIILVYIFSIPFDKHFTKTIGVLLLVLWLIDGNLKKKIEQIIKCKVVVVFFIFLAYNYFSLFWTEHLKYAYGYVGIYKYYLPAIIIFTSIKKEYIKYAISVFLIAMFISEVITYGIFFEFWTTKYNQLKNFSSPTAFMSHTIYSSILAFTALLTLNKIILIENYKIKIFVILFFISISINLFISGGRTGLVPYIVVSILMLLFLYKVKIIHFLLAILLMFSLIFVAYKNISFFKSRINQAQYDIQRIVDDNYTSSFGTRVAMIHVGLKIFADNPLLGVGIEDNMDKMREYAKNNNEHDFKHLKYYVSHFHNQYIDILTQSGIIGLSLFLSLFYFLLKIPIKNEEMNNIKFIFVFSILFSMISSDLFHQKHFIYLIGVFVGLILAQNRYESIENNLNNKTFTNKE